MQKFMKIYQVNAPFQQYYIIVLSIRLLAIFGWMYLLNWLSFGDMRSENQEYRDIFMLQCSIDFSSYVKNEMKV